MKKVFKQSVSFLLSFIMIVSVFTIIPVTVGAESSDRYDKVVAALTQLVDGDEERAKEIMESLHTSGLVDEDGNMVDLDVREEGRSVSLSELTSRINSGDKVGDITVNGNAATTDQVVQIQQVDSLLDIIQQIDTDVEITNEHVANFESLLEGIENGSIDLNNAIKSGALKMTSKKAASTDSTRNSGLKSGSSEVREVRFVSTIKVTDDIVDFLYEQLYMPSGFSRDQAQKDLQDLCDAGVIDWNGNFIALNVYEDDQKADLDKLIERIEKGETVGSLNVNGNAVTSVQIVKIQLVDRLMKTVAKHSISTTSDIDEIRALNTLLKSGKINLSWFAENMASFLIDKSSIGKGNVTDALSNALIKTFIGAFRGRNG